MKRLSPTFACAALLAALAAGDGSARAGTSVGEARPFAPDRVVVKFDGEPRGRALALPAGTEVPAAARALRRNPRVAYAEPDYLAAASSEPVTDFPLPDDSGTLRGTAEASAAVGGWAFRQWNFMPAEPGADPRLPLSPGGIDAGAGWRHLAAAGRPGAAGVTVAVLDTGIAYRSLGGRFAASPDFTPSQFVPGYDFVARDGLPLDRNGHGTHVAGTIAEKTDNAIGLTGLAYEAKLMPVRVLAGDGTGYATTIAKGIRFAISNHAQVINMSFNFDCGERVPMVDEALRAAYAHGIVTVASAGNLSRGQGRGEKCVSGPATGPRVIGVGGVTEGGCLGRYSLAGAAIDVVAPGGGAPRRGCASVLARPIYQVTLRHGSTDEFAIPASYTGTSMAAAHVSGVAAMVLASGVLAPRLGPRARVDAVIRQLRRSARDLGLPRLQQGAGLIDAGQATEPRGPTPAK